MLAVERECIHEDNKKCVLCRKWIRTNYLVIVDGIKSKYYHHACYKSLFLTQTPEDYLVCFACDDPIRNDGVYEIYANEIQLFHNNCSNILFRKTTT